MSIEEYAKLVQSLQQTLQQLQETVAALRADLAKRDGELAELRRMLFGKRRERMPPIEREIAKKSADPEARKEKARQRRVAAAQRKRELPEVEVIHPVDPEREKCLGCDGPFRDLGAGEASFEIEYVPARVVTSDKNVSAAVAIPSWLAKRPTAWRRRSSMAQACTLIAS